MKTVEDIRGNCHIDEAGHWLWRGGIVNGFPRVYGPDWTETAARLEAALQAADGKRYENAMIKAALLEASEPVLSSQPGRRAVWHAVTGKPIPSGWRVFGTCDEGQCLNVDHMDCGSSVKVGKHTRKTGRYRGQLNRILANRATSLKRSSLTPALISEIRASSETGRALSQRLGIGETLISRVRVHGAGCHEPIGGVFSGLMR